MLFVSAPLKIVPSISHFEFIPDVLEKFPHPFRSCWFCFGSMRWSWTFWGFQRLTSAYSPWRGKQSIRFTGTVYGPHWLCWIIISQWQLLPTIHAHSRSAIKCSIRTTYWMPSTVTSKCSASNLSVCETVVWWKTKPDSSFLFTSGTEPFLPMELTLLTSQWVHFLQSTTKKTVSHIFLSLTVRSYIRLVCDLPQYELGSHILLYICR